MPPTKKLYTSLSFTHRRLTPEGGDGGVDGGAVDAHAWVGGEGRKFINEVVKYVVRVQCSVAIRVAKLAWSITRFGHFHGRLAFSYRGVYEVILSVWHFQIPAAFQMLLIFLC